jgi:hypothetical protein
LASLAGCKQEQAATVKDHDRATTVADLEEQLTRQFREQWPDERVEAIEIIRFGSESGSVLPGGGYWPIGVRIRWSPDPNLRFTETQMMLYRAADKYCVGTLELRDKPTPVNVILRFR